MFSSQTSGLDKLIPLRAVGERLLAAPKPARIDFFVFRRYQGATSTALLLVRNYKRARMKRWEVLNGMVVMNDWPLLGIVFVAKAVQLNKLPELSKT